MATKAELEEEVASLKAQLAAAGAAAGAAAVEAEYEDGKTYLYTDGIGFTTVEVEEGGGAVDAAAADRVAMLEADLQRVSIERDAARHALAQAREQIANMGKLHGSIDSLPSVVG